MIITKRKLFCQDFCRIPRTQAPGEQVTAAKPKIVSQNRHKSWKQQVFPDRMKHTVQERRFMEITKDTRITDILNEYGDIADVMELFGVKRVGRYSVRALAARALTVEWAARIHRVPLDEFLSILKKAIQPKGDQL